MALTQISTAGVKDDAVTSGKIPANAVGSSELADNAVDTAAIADDAVTAAKLANDIAISTTGTLGSGNLTVTSSSPEINLVDSGDNPDYKIRNQDGTLRITDTTNNAGRFVVNSDGHIDVVGNLDVGAGVDVTGDITLTGNVEAGPKIVTNEDGGGHMYFKNNSGSSLNYSSHFQTYRDTDEAGTTQTHIHYYHGGYCELLHQGDSVIRTLADGVQFRDGGAVKGQFTDEGLCFGTDTSSSNALDDYEEGSYTATIYGSDTGTGSPFGMNPDKLRYTKIGRVVHVSGRVYIHSSSNNPTGSARMLLPFTSAANNQGQDGQGYSYVTRYNVYSPNDDWNLVFEIEPNSSYGGLLWCKPGANWASMSAENHTNQNAAYYGFDFTYTTTN